MGHKEDCSEQAPRPSQQFEAPGLERPAESMSQVDLQTMTSVQWTTLGDYPTNWKAPVKREFGALVVDD